MPLDMNFKNLYDKIPGKCPSESQVMMMMLVLNTEGKILGFGENIASRFGTTYPFLQRPGFKNSDYRGFLYAKLDANVTSKYFDELKGNENFVSSYHNLKEFGEKCLTSDTYKDMGTLIQLSEVELSNKLGLGGRVKLDSLRKAIESHKKFGFSVIDTTENNRLLKTTNPYEIENAGITMCLPEKDKPYNALWVGLDYTNSYKIKPDGKYSIDKLINDAKTNPVLLPNPIHYECLESDKT